VLPARVCLPDRNAVRGPPLGKPQRRTAVWARVADGPGVVTTLVHYAGTDLQALWQAGAATALFVAGFGTAGYATRRDLSGLARVGSWALLALIVFGIVLIFVHIPGGALVYSVLGLVIFAALIMFDFQRLRRSTDLDSAPLIAASIFLDALNVFLLFLQIFDRRRE
jgi:modulator of FtsH protease